MLDPVKIMAAIIVVSFLYAIYGAWACRRNRFNFRDLAEEFITLLLYTVVALCIVWGFVASFVYLVS